MTGKITQFETVSEPGNYELRIFLGGQVVCNHQDAYIKTFAYLNSSDTNYKAIVSSLTLAFATGRSVTINTINDGGSGCHIHDVIVSG